MTSASACRAPRSSAPSPSACGASLVREPLHVPRIALTVPSIIMMTPGLYAFQTIVFLNQGKVTDAIAAGAVCCFAVGAMAMGLIAARFITERQWRFER